MITKKIIDGKEVFVKTTPQPDSEEEFTLLELGNIIGGLELEKMDIQKRINELKAKKAEAEAVK